MNQVQLNFFNSLFGGYRELGFIELRSLTSRPDGRKDSRAYFYGGIAEAVQGFNGLAVGVSEARQDLYFGVLPRSSNSSFKSAVTQARVLWVDIDAKTCTKQECIDGLYQGKVPTPSYIVDSGGGIHCYWLLEETIPAGEAELMSYGLARHTGGDNCHNADRILRVPGTYNFKNPEEPRLVQVLSSTGFSYPPSAFEKFRTVGEEYQVGQNILDGLEPATVALEELYDSLPNFLVEYVLYGLAADIHDTFRSDRSRLDFYIISKLLKNGFTPNQVAGILTTSEYAISGKTLSKRGRARTSYLTNSISRAQALINEERVEELV